MSGSPLTLIIGTTPAPQGACMALAMALRDHAQAAGLQHCRIAASRVNNSDSRYLSFVDAGGRHWTMRISSHRRKRGEVHFDLTSLDGVSGIDQARSFIDRVAAGLARWFQPAPIKRIPRRKRS